MNITIIIACSIGVVTTFLLQGVIILGVLKLSLKWQIQAKNNTLPTIDNPIKQVIEGKKMEKKVQEYKNAFEEYLHGDPEKEGK